MDWCGDPRAFTAHFENNLMLCLQVVNNVARSSATNLDLGRRGGFHSLLGYMTSACLTFSDRGKRESGGEIGGGR